MLKGWVMITTSNVNHGQVTITTNVNNAKLKRLTFSQEAPYRYSMRYEASLNDISHVKTGIMNLMNIAGKHINGDNFSCSIEEAIAVVRAAAGDKIISEYYDTGNYEEEIYKQKEVAEEYYQQLIHQEEHKKHLNNQAKKQEELEIEKYKQKLKEANKESFEGFKENIRPSFETSTAWFIFTIIFMSLAAAFSSNINLKDAFFTALIVGVISFFLSLTFKNGISSDDISDSTAAGIGCAGIMLIYGALGAIFSSTIYAKDILPVTITSGIFGFVVFLILKRGWRKNIKITPPKLRDSVTEEEYEINYIEEHLPHCDFCHTPLFPQHMIEFSLTTETLWVCLNCKQRVIDNSYKIVP